MLDQPGIRYLKHACLFVRTDDVSVIFDPIEPAQKADIVCISHCHEDHYSPSALSSIDRSTPVVVPKIANPRPKSKMPAVFHLASFKPTGEDDEFRYGDLLAQVVLELEAFTQTPRGRLAGDELKRARFLKETWDKMGPALRQVVLKTLAEPRPEDPSSYRIPKERGLQERWRNPDMAVEIRALGFQDVVELPPWGEFRRGRTLLTLVPANFAHGVTQQATYLLESPAFTLFNGVDAMEDPAVHSYVGRNYVVDIAFLPVTGRSFLEGTPWAYRHTMDVEAAARVARWLGARWVVPFKDEIVSSDLRAVFRGLMPECLLLEPGDTWNPNPQGDI